MAGSRKWQVYTADDGAKFAVSLDESNGEATGFDDFDSADAFPPLPKGFRMRYGLFIDPDTGAARKIPIGKPDDPLITGGSIAISLFLSGAPGVADWVLFFLSAVVGERRRRPVHFDTGLLDGDET